MPRAFILVLDSLGVGASQDAYLYQNELANTLGHISEYCIHTRKIPLHIPYLEALGLNYVLMASTGYTLQNHSLTENIKGSFGYAVECSINKDTPSGHWEIAGVPVFAKWGHFQSFPANWIQNFIKAAQLPGILANKAASGTQVIQEYGLEHIKTLKPIIYTSADSVLQIAAHETYFGLERLYEVCQIASQLSKDLNIARIIARPFLGTEPPNFYRTPNRHDYTLPPPKPTLLDRLCEANKQVIGIGKISDIFAHHGISKSVKSKDNDDTFFQALQMAKEAQDNTLIFANFVDFDSSYGHRRDVIGYAAALEAFDKKIPELLSLLLPEDLVIITADHGCDPTFPGSDHTREHVPILAFGPKVQSCFLGRRESFADIGQTIAEHLGIEALDFGISFYPLLFKEK